MSQKIVFNCNYNSFIQKYIFTIKVESVRTLNRSLVNFSLLKFETPLFSLSLPEKVWKK